jgi:hypothetical protein
MRADQPIVFGVRTGRCEQRFFEEVARKAAASRFQLTVTQRPISALVISRNTLNRDEVIRADNRRLR